MSATATKQRNHTLEGFSYDAGQSLALRRSEWDAKFEAVIAAGGSQRRIAGDMTAFDARGRMIFEAYDY